MLDLGLIAVLAGLLALGLRRPFLWVLTYIYVDIVSPQKISYGLLASVPVSLVMFVAAFASWLVLDDKRDSRFTLRQGLMVLLLLYCGLTTLLAQFPAEAASKWSWVWKALVFAIFLPLTLRTRLRIEAAALFMVLSLSAIVIGGGIKTLGGGGGYGQLSLLVNDNTGIYEGSTLSMVAVAMIPLVVWLARHGTIFRPDWRVTLFAAGLVFACGLIPVGTQTRTGLLCLALLAGMSLRSARRPLLYLASIAAVLAVAIPFLPASYTGRMSTIENHQSDQSASTRLAVWAWTLDYAKDRPFGGGFNSFLANHIQMEIVDTRTSGSTVTVETTMVQDEARAFHSSYFELLGEQGWPGLGLWLALQAAGLWQMEVLRRRWRKRTGPDEQWQAPLANALQQAQVIYLVGGAFVGIAYQPMILTIIGLQCGLWSYLQRIERGRDDDGPGQLSRPSRRPRRRPMVAA
ncbi:putative O-glycosylation ligase, exosortase A system-associated [Novosphingobium soli]|uniref:O-glycosylation ligase, exosortase A system-associated n=1 Tax=Novosphingobium soli TaxID=574956 RepID=A0ABV6CZB1_9SPHN